MRFRLQPLGAPHCEGKSWGIDLLPCFATQIKYRERFQDVRGDWSCQQRLHVKTLSRFINQKNGRSIKEP